MLSPVPGYMRTQTGHTYSGFLGQKRVSNQPSTDGSPIYVGQMAVSQEEMAYRSLDDAISTISSQIERVRRRDPSAVELMKFYFGFSHSEHQIVAGLLKIRSVLETVQLRENLSLNLAASSGVLASVIRQLNPGEHSKVYLSPLFFQANELRRVMTLIHEASHMALQTEDLVYGRDRSLDLARTDPRQALRNADNWSFFAVGGGLKAGGAYAPKVAKSLPDKRLFKARFEGRISPFAADLQANSSIGLLGFQPTVLEFDRQSGMARASHLVICV